MRSNQATVRPTDGDDADERPAGAVRSEEIHIRNHDPYWGYDLALTVTDDGGETVFEDRYYLQPGQIEGVGGVLDAGEYEATVELDNHYRKTVDCRVDGSPEHTIHVELGNGIASVTEGLYG